MFKFICFLIANLVISEFLERRKWKVATVAHSVLFIFFLFVSLFSNEVPGSVALSRLMFGREATELLNWCITHNSDLMLAPMTVAGILLISELILIASVITVDKVERIRKKELSRKNIFGTKKEKILDAVIPAKKKVRLCYLLCVMRC